MHNENDFLDKLFSDKLGNLSPNTSDEEWNALNTKLSRVNFFKFSITTLNIYYLALIMAFAGTSGYLSYNNYKQSATIKELQQKIEQQSISSSNIIEFSKDSVTSGSLEPATPQPAKYTKCSNTAKTNTNIATNENALNQIITTSDSVATTLTDIIAKSDSVPINTSRPTTIKRIKKTVYLKRDTIIVKDAIKIKK